MHYVPKNKFTEGLTGSAEALSSELYGAQEKLVELDQNNLGTAGGIFVPGGPGLMNTGIGRTACALPSTLSSEPAHKSLTRWHYATAAAGVNITSTDTWTDQTTATLSFKVYRTGPYLIMGGAQLTQDGTGATALNSDTNPLRGDMTVRLNGELVTPYTTVGYGAGTLTEVIKAPMFFMGSRILYPGDWTAVVSIRQNPGDSATVSNVDIGVIGFIR